MSVTAAHENVESADCPDETLSSPRCLVSNEGLQSPAATSPPTSSFAAGGCSGLHARWLDADVASPTAYRRPRRRTRAARRWTPRACVVPGFIDAHMHLESVKLLVDEFARLVLPLGTTAVVADPHEIANVLGVDGVHWLLDASAGLQLDVFFMAPSCVPASPFESPRRTAPARRPRVADAAPAGPRAGRDDELPRRHRRLPAELAKLALEGAQHVDGHAPGSSARSSRRMRQRASVRSRGVDRRGGARAAACRMWLLIREASMARNLRALLPLVQEYGPGRMAFCTDDRDPEDIADNGHINGMVREAVAAGIAPEDALVMASFHPAQWHRLHRLGAVAPGYQADLLLLPDLEQLRPGRRPEARPPIDDVPAATCRSGCGRP